MEFKEAKSIISAKIQAYPGHLRSFNKRNGEDINADQLAEDLLVFLNSAEPSSEELDNLFELVKKG